eukprot:gene11777-15758_t
MPTEFKIHGSISDFDSYFCEYLAKRISKIIGEESSSIDFILTTEFDFFAKLSILKKQYPAISHSYSKPHIVFRNDKLVGDITSLINIGAKEFEMEDADIPNTILINRYLREESYKVLSSIKNPIVYLDFVQNAASNKPIQFERIYIELLQDLCPKACENFILLCTGTNLNYAGSPIHRIVEGGWIQGGDIIDGSGKNSVSAYNEYDAVPDESFSVDFGNSFGGILGYANTGPHSNGSQFFITLGPCEWMNHKFVGFGKIIQGYSSIKQFNQIPTSNQVPTVQVVIGACGQGVSVLEEHTA